MKVLCVRTIFVGMLAASVLLISACSKKADEPSDPSEVVIPDSPDAAVQTIISEFAKGNSAIFWRALPASYQSDVNGLMYLAGSKADKEVYNKSFSLLARLADIIDQQKSFIVNSSFMQSQSPENVSKLETVIPSIAGLINTIASSELSSIEGLLNFNGKAFFETTVSRCIEHLEAIGQLSGDGTKLADYASTIVSVVQTDGKQATLSIAIPGREAEELVFTKVQKRWVPVEIESEWVETIEEITTSLQDIPAENFDAQKTQIMGALTMFDGILTRIASAETQEQFDQSLKESTMPAMSMFMMLSQAAESPD